MGAHYAFARQINTAHFGLVAPIWTLELAAQVAVLLLVTMLNATKNQLVAKLYAFRI